MLCARAKYRSTRAPTRSSIDARTESCSDPAAASFDGRDDADSQCNPTHRAGIIAPETCGVIDFGG